ncbi:ThiF family adenylyltransferase [Candidatus Micrarchaeota archaeon]|nr:ThiF family adenylyltransferase [Candidatus Micrarchaeota archaeon]
MSFYSEKFRRNPLTKAQQEKVRKASFAIIGLGGTGGFMLENLIRMGAERLMVFDSDRFELSNFNRQSLATDDFMDMPKVHAALARAKAINKDIELTAAGHFDGSSDIRPADIVLDGTDTLDSKAAIAAAARRAKLPYVFCSAASSRGMVSVFTTYRFEKAFQIRELPEHKHPACSDILCPAASLAGTLAASQAVNITINKPFVKAPQALFFDLFRKNIFWRARLG